MKINQLILMLSLSVAMLACKGKLPAPEETAIPSAVEPIEKGADVDDHGCRTSAGFIWSMLKNECIQVENEGIRLEPKDSTLDKTVAAYLVFKTETDDAQAELFLPGESSARMFEKQPNGGSADAGTWKGDNLIIKVRKGMYVVEDSQKKALYEGNVASK